MRTQCTLFARVQLLGLTVLRAAALYRDPKKSGLTADARRDPAAEEEAFVIEAYLQCFATRGAKLVLVRARLLEWQSPCSERECADGPRTAGGRAPDVDHCAM